MLHITQGDGILLSSLVCRGIYHLVNVHTCSTCIGERQGVVTLCHVCGKGNFLPFVGSRLCARQCLRGGIDCGGESSVCAVGGITHAYLITTCFVDVYCVAERACRVCAHIHKSVAGIASLIWIPTVRVEHTTFDIFIIHIFRFDYDFTVILGRLFGQVGRERTTVHHIRAAPCGVSCTFDAYIHWPLMGYFEGIGSFGRIPCRGGYGSSLRSLGKCVCRVCGGSGHFDDIACGGCGICAEIVQIEVDMVRIFFDEVTTEFSPVEIQTFAGIILQRYTCRGGCLAIQIGIWGVGNQLILVARYV